MAFRPGVRPWGFAGLAALLGLYLLTGHGGIRSPDAEIAFETCEALADGRGFEIEPASAWPGFGYARGRDGAAYGVFGPLQPLVCAPLLALVDRVVPGFEGTVRPSHYTRDGLVRFALGKPIDEPREPHVRRALVAWIFNALVTMAGVAAFLAVARRLRSGPEADLATGLYAVGSLAWPYAGTFFSEPLTTLCGLLALRALLGAPRARNLALAGLCLGLASAAHVTGLLFVPTLPLLALAGARRNRERVRRLLPVLAGLVPVLLLLAWFDHHRFGDVLETGRWADVRKAEAFRYGVWTWPWQGLHGLLVSGGKGLLWYCPAAALGLLGTRALVRQNRRLAAVLGATILLRLLFVAARSDWHGGFALGPRLLLPVLPLMVLPAVPWLGEVLAARRRRTLAGAGLAGLGAALEQAFFVLREPFMAMHAQKRLNRGVDLFSDDGFFVSWSTAPIRHLLETRRGPWLLEAVPLGDAALLAVFGAGLAGLLLLRLRPLLQAPSPQAGRYRTSTTVPGSG